METAVSAVRIRAATADDAEAVAALSDELRAHVGDATGHLSAAAVRRDAFGARPEFTILVAEADGVVVGYALYFPAYEPAFAARGLYLADLCVTAAARRRGVGRALLDAVAEAAAADSRTFVQWLVNPANASALTFYKALVPDAVVPTIAHVRILSQSM
jgi:predicted N-acetyltransferase YhbS